MTLPFQPAAGIRPLSTHEELQQIAPLQRLIWRYSDLEVDSAALLTVGSRYSGQVLGAFLQDRLIGFSYAVAMLEAGRLHSHRVGVHPDFQNLGIGRQLKLAQRDYALQQDIGIIQWTFDPLQPGNAHFNIALLGAIAKNYLPNFYGITSSPLHGGLPTDRLLVEWFLESPRVSSILSGRPLVRCDDFVEIRIPVIELSQHRSNVQTRIRADFLERFAHGYFVSGFRQEKDSYFYTLERL